MISFSTCWNSARNTDGDKMLRQIRNLGFNFVELGHGIRISLMPGIQQMYDKGEVKFSSLHNFCPLPVEVMGASPDCYQFSSPYAKERERAIKQTLQTIDFADYRDIDGVKVPFSLKGSSAVQTFFILVKKVEHNVNVDPARFAKPAQ